MTPLQRAQVEGAGDRAFEVLFTAVCLVALVIQALTIGWFSYEVVVAVVHAA